MRIGIKEFQRRVPGILKEAPFVITVRGKPLVEVHTFKVHTKEEKDKEVHTKDKVHTPKVKLQTKQDVFCKKHGGYKITCGCD